MTVQYRPEIDGLRAIAVMSVIIYHAQFLMGDKNILSGGFIGVDIFFVISGYLISLILLRAFRDDNFSLKNFYIRRVRRILPILFTVMLVSLPFAWFTMMPQDARNYAGSILSSLTFVSNIWFWRESSYWAPDAHLKPFLHTWSLSVEEQFYIFYPLVLFALLRFLPRYTTAIMVLGFVSSLALAQYASMNMPIPSFYLLPTRGWELLTGALLAKIEFDRGGRYFSPFIGAWMPKLALALIAASLLLFDTHTLHPSLYTLAPVLGTMMIIWFCREGEIITRLLSSRFFVGLGLISYGLYIWHYPIFAFAQLINHEQGQFEKFIWIAFSIILAALTYFTIEKPARNSNIIPTRHLLVALSISFIIIAGATSYNFINKGLWHRYNHTQLTYMGMDDRHALTHVKYVPAAYNQHRGLHFKDSGKKRLLIIGDSFSQDLFNVLNEGKFLDDIEVLTHYIAERCHNVPASAHRQEFVAPEDLHECSTAIRVGDASLDNALREADMVIMATSWMPISIEHLRSLYEEASRRTKAPVVVFGSKAFENIGNRGILALKASDDIRSIRTPMHNENHLARIALTKKMMANTGLYVDFHAIICGDKDNTCPTTTQDGHALSHDGAHLTRAGAVYVAERLKGDRVFMKLWNDVFNSNQP